MGAALAFLASHWRLTVALLLAVAVFVEHERAGLAEAQRDAAVAQAQQWKLSVEQQNASITALKTASDDRDLKAQKAVQLAKEGQASDQLEIRRLLALQPKPGQDRCEAARELIWSSVSGERQ